MYQIYASSTMGNLFYSRFGGLSADRATARPVADTEVGYMTEVMIGTRRLTSLGGIYVVAAGAPISAARRVA